MILRKLPDQVFCRWALQTARDQRTGEASLPKPVAHFLRGLHHASHSQKDDILLVVDDLALSESDGCPKLRAGRLGLASGVTNGNRAVIVHRKFHHIRKLPFILGGHDAHVRNRGQKRKVENSLMGLSVAPHKTCPVNGKDHMHVLDTDVMQDLIVGPLKEEE